MRRDIRARALSSILWMVLVVAVALALSGCGGDTAKAPEKPAGKTAKSLYETAKSQLSTTAPDAKLLVVQTAQAVSATGTPVWAYLFGSPETDTIYIVYMNEDNPMPASEYGKAGLSADEWKAVPDIGDWKIDSDEAYEKALAESGAKGAPAQWVMGMVTYVPESSGTDAVKPFVWNVNFDPGESGATTKTIEVDAATGKVSQAK